VPTNLRQVQTKKNFSRYQYPLLKFKLEKNHVIYYISKQLKKIRRMIKPVQMNQLNFKPALLHNFPLSTWSSLLSPIIDLNLFFTIFILLNICSPLANVTGIVFANMNALYTKGNPLLLFFARENSWANSTALPETLLFSCLQTSAKISLLDWKTQRTRFCILLISISTHTSRYKNAKGGSHGS